MENNIFSFNRFALLLKRDFSENFKKNIMYFLTLFGIITVVCTIQSIDFFYDKISSNQTGLNNEMLGFLMGVFFFASLIFGSTMMNPISNKTKRTSFLMLPSSSLEKYLSRWILVVVLYVVFFFAAMYLADLVRVLISSIIFKSVKIEYLNIGALISSNYFNSWLYLNLALAFYLYAQSLFILGTTFWQKNAFVKTFVACVVIVTAYSLFTSGFANLFFKDIRDLSNALGNVSWIRKLDNIGEQTGITLVIIGLLVLSAFNWVLGYFRFKETEIINRW